jgi:hypothetical protein
LLREKHLALAPLDLRGALADASVALLIVGVAGVFFATRRWWGRALGLVTVVSLVWVSFAMYEFISVFDSLYALSHAGFLADSTFVGGSVRHLQHPVLLGSLTALAVAAGLWARVPGQRWWRWWGAAFALSVFGQFVIPATRGHDEWRQRHAVQANLSFWPAFGATGSGSIRADLGDVFRGDLSGKRWAGPLSEQPNVLLILIEAASGAHLPSVAAAQGVQSGTTMPKLDALAQRHIFFTRLISHQRQTNRGEYGILCGDYPKLLTDAFPKSSVMRGMRRPISNRRRLPS